MEYAREICGEIKEKIEKSNKQIRKEDSSSVSRGAVTAVKQYEANPVPRVVIQGRSKEQISVFIFPCLACEEQGDFRTIVLPWANQQPEISSRPVNKDLGPYS